MIIAVTDLKELRFEERPYVKKVLMKVLWSKHWNSLRSVKAIINLLTFYLIYHYCLWSVLFLLLTKATVTAPTRYSSVSIYGNILHYFSEIYMFCTITQIIVNPAGGLPKITLILLISLLTFKKFDFTWKVNQIHIITAWW